VHDRPPAYRERVALCVLPILLSGRMTMVTPRQQVMTVVSDFEADCVAQMGGVELARGREPLDVAIPTSARGALVSVRCGKDGVYRDAAVMLEDRRTASFLWGGLVGQSVDESSGAAWKYPEKVVVELRPRVAEDDF
jgi:hypothetical protein